MLTIHPIYIYKNDQLLINQRRVIFQNIDIPNHRKRLSKATGSTMQPNLSIVLKEYNRANNQTDEIIDQLLINLHEEIIQFNRPNTHQ